MSERATLFEFPPLGEPLASKAFKAEALTLRQELLAAQRALRRTRRGLIVVMAGPNGCGKQATVNRLNEWMDPRWITTRAFTTPSDEERERPPHWRFWMNLPPRGQVACFLSSWYSRPLVSRVYGGGRKRFERALDRIRDFEAMLAADGTVILKFWMHLDDEEQRHRLRQLEEDPLRSWQVNERDWHNVRSYDAFMNAAETAIERTSSDAAPWHVVDGRDPRRRELEVARTVLDAMRAAVDNPAPKSAEPRSRNVRPRKGQRAQVPTITGLKMPAPLTKPDYKRQLEVQQQRFSFLRRQMAELRGSPVLVFEGVDAARKGGSSDA